MGAALAPLAARAAAARPGRWRVACRDAHLSATGQPDCWAAMQFLGVDGVEVNVSTGMVCPNLVQAGESYRLDSPAALQRLRDDLAAHGRVITALLMANRFDEQLDQELAWGRRVVAAAQALGIKAVRIDVAPRTTPRDQFLPVAIHACKALCALAEGTPVRFGIENHGNTTNDPEFLARLFDGVGSTHLGLTLDTANFYWYGHPLDSLYGIYQRFASRMVHTHCKNIHYPADRRNAPRPIGWEYERYACPLAEGDIDFHRLVTILRRAHYPGDLCVEDESLGRFPAAQRGAVLQKDVAFLRALDV